MTRHFLDIDDLSCDELDDVLATAALPVAEVPQVLAGRGAALVFEKPSARTRSSTELAVVALGGHPVYIQGAEVGIDERETAEDVARTLACYHAVLCARVIDHATLVRMVAALEPSTPTADEVDEDDEDERFPPSVPVVNLLSDRAPSVSGPRRSVDVAPGVRECRGPYGGLHRRRQQRVAVAGAGGGDDRDPDPRPPRPRGTSPTPTTWPAWPGSVVRSR